MNAFSTAIMHCHMSSDLRLAILIRTLRPNSRIVYHSHVGIGRPKQDFLHRFVYARVDVVIAISQFVANQLLSKTPIQASRLALIPYGIDESVFLPLEQERRERVRQSYGFRPSDFVVCLPGRISDGKGHLLLAQAVSLIESKVPVKLIFAGSKDTSTESSKNYNHALDAFLDDSSIRERVTFLGHVNLLPQLMASSDVICIPSANEAFGLVVIEAMSCGVPVLGAQAGAIPEIIKEGAGELLRLDQPNAWAKKLTELWSNPESRMTYGAIARKRVLENYTSARHLEHILKLYDSLGSTPL
jgi:glycosyltransferase involved in cell wall biosynthesis